jgi:hypothetical protein
VQSAGYAYRLDGQLLKQEFNRAVACSICCCAITRCSPRWPDGGVQPAPFGGPATLLLSLDRLPSNEPTMTQELIANMLGVPRGGVTQTAGKLPSAGLIHYSRGPITVLDRPRFEAEHLRVLCSRQEGMRSPASRRDPTVVSERTGNFSRGRIFEGKSYMCATVQTPQHIRYNFFLRMAGSEPQQGILQDRVR